MSYSTYSAIGYGYMIPRTLYNAVNEKFEAIHKYGLDEVEMSNGEDLTDYITPIPYDSPTMWGYFVGVKYDIESTELDPFIDVSNLNFSDKESFVTDIYNKYFYFVIGDAFTPKEYLFSYTV